MKSRKGLVAVQPRTPEEEEKAKADGKPHVLIGWPVYQSGVWGLIVHRTVVLNRAGNRIPGNLWTVSHRMSGCAIGSTVPFKSMKGAKRLAELLRGITNWGVITGEQAQNMCGEAKQKVLEAINTARSEE